MKRTISIGLGILLTCLTAHPTVVIADGDWEAKPKRKIIKSVPRYKAPPVEPTNIQYREPEPVSPANEEVTSQWMTRMSAGAPVWLFKNEDTTVGGGVYLDIWNTDVPLNYRVGAEIRHMTLEQEAADFARERPDKDVQITFLRIPFAVEYMQAVDDATTLYLGGGPDLFHTANDISETSVGLHLAGRLHYALDQNWGVAVEGGYMWGAVDGEDSDVDFDGAFVTPTIAYTF